MKPTTRSTLISSLVIGLCVVLTMAFLHARTVQLARKPVTTSNCASWPTAEPGSWVYEFQLPAATCLPQPVLSTADVAAYVLVDNGPSHNSLAATVSGSWALPFSTLFVHESDLSKDMRSQLHQALAGPGPTSATLAWLATSFSRSAAAFASAPAPRWHLFASQSTWVNADRLLAALQKLPSTVPAAVGSVDASVARRPFFSLQSGFALNQLAFERILLAVARNASSLQQDTAFDVAIARLMAQEGVLLVHASNWPHSESQYKQGASFMWGHIGASVAVANVAAVDMPILTSAVLHEAEVPPNLSSLSSALSELESRLDVCLSSKLGNSETPVVPPEPQTPEFKEILLAPPHGLSLPAELNKPLPRLAIVTFLTGSAFSKLSVYLSATACYAATHGYPFFVETQRLERPSGLNVHYNKPRALLKYLPFAQWVLFLDGDNVPVNRSTPLDQFLDDRFDVLVPDRWFGEMHPGVAVKNSEFGFEFLRSWLKWGQRGFVFNGDNAILHEVVVRAALPEYVNQCDALRDSLPQTPPPGYSSETWLLYFHWLRCLRDLLPASAGGEFPPHVKIYPPGRSWTRDPLPAQYRSAYQTLPSDVFMHTKAPLAFVDYRDLYCLPPDQGRDTSRLAPAKNLPFLKQFLPAAFDAPARFIWYHEGQRPALPEAA